MAPVWTETAGKWAEEIKELLLVRKKTLIGEFFEVAKDGNQDQD